MWLALNVSFGFYDGQARNKNTLFSKEIFFTLERAQGTTESESNSKDISYFKNEKFTQQDYMISLKRAAERLRIIQQSRYYAFSLRITWHDSTYVSNTSAILFCHVWFKLKNVN